MERTLLSIGYYKGELDFRASALVCDLTVEEMQEVRAMTVCAIGIIEDMFRRAKDRENPASEAITPPSEESNQTEK